MYGPVSAGTIADRFNNPNSAIHLNGGYYMLPNGVYFSGELTVTVWAYVLSVSDPSESTNKSIKLFPHILLIL